MPERSDFLEGDAPAAAKVEAFLAQALAATGERRPDHGRGPGPLDLRRPAVEPLGQGLRPRPHGLPPAHAGPGGRRPCDVTADHVKLYKRALLEAGRTSATVARRLSVLRGTYKQLAAKGLISWETAQDIAAVKAPGVQKNSTPSLTQQQAIALLEAIPADTLQGIRDLALMSVFFLTGCRVSAVTGACVGHLETDGVEHFLHVTEKRNKKRRKILLDAARPVLAYVARAGIGEDKEGPLFRPMTPDGSGFVRRHLDRKTPWRLVKKYCEAAGIDPDAAGRPRHRHPLACGRRRSTTPSATGRRCTLASHTASFNNPVRASFSPVLPTTRRLAPHSPRRCTWSKWPPISRSGGFSPPPASRAGGESSSGSLNPWPRSASAGS